MVELLFLIAGLVLILSFLALFLGLGAGLFVGVVKAFETLLYMVRTGTLDPLARQKQRQALFARLSVPLRQTPPPVSRLQQLLKPPRMMNEEPELTIRLEASDESFPFADPFQVRIRFTPAARLPANLDIRLWLSTLPINPIPGRLGLKLEVDRADRILLVDGTDEAGLLSVLDHETRAELVSLFNAWGDALCIDAAGAHLKVNDTPDLEKRLTGLPDRLRTLFQRLCRNEGRQERLEAIVLSDPDPSIRLRALPFYLQSGGPNQRWTLARLLADPAWEVSLEAARALDDETGEAHLVRMVEEAPPPQAEQALEVLGRQKRAGSMPRIRAALARLPSLRVAAPAVAALGDRECVPLLLERLMTTQDQDETLALVGALRVLADVRASATLARMLDRELEGGLKLEVIRALETCGEKEAVERLHPLANRRLGGQEKAAARQAIAAIQARLGPVGKGWLTVAEGSIEGALSEAVDSRAGALSDALGAQAGALSETAEDRAGALSDAEDRSSR